MSQDLFQWFNELPEDEKTVLETLCFGFRGLSSTALFNWLAKSGIKKEGNIPYKPAEISAILAKSVKIGFLELHNVHYNSIKAEYRTPLLKSFLHKTIRNNRLNKGFIENFPTLRLNQYWILEEQVINIYSILNQALLLENQAIVNKSMDELLFIAKLSNNLNLAQVIFYGNDALMPRIIAFDKVNELNKEWLSVQINDLTEKSFSQGITNPQLIEALTSSSKAYPEFESYKLSHLFLKGDFNTVISLTENNNYAHYQFLRLFSFFVTGKEVQPTISWFLDQQAKLRETKQEFVLDGFASFFQVPLLLSQDKSKHPKITKYCKEFEASWAIPLKFYASCFKHLGLNNAKEHFTNDCNKIPFTHDSYWNTLILNICLYWLNGGKKQEVKNSLDIALTNIQNTDSKYLELEFINLIALIFEEDKDIEYAEKLKKELGVVRCISEIYTPPSEWELKLNLLANISGKTAAKALEPKDERIVWLITPRSGSIQPVIQKANKNGIWSAGRNVALNSLKNNLLACITEFDKPVIAMLKTDYRYYSGSHYYFDRNAITALIGHPYLFLEDAPTVPIKLEADEIQLIVEEKAGKCHFSFTHSLIHDANTLVKQSTNSYKIITASNEIRSIAGVIGENLTVPSAAKPKVLETLKLLAGTVKIQSSLIGEQTGAKRVDASTNLFIHLMPLGSGIKADLYVKPLALEPPYLHPAEGLKKITGHIDDVHVWTERNFEAETTVVDQLMERCPIFASQAAEDSSAQFDDPSECLQVLSEFREAPDLVTVEWPRGQKLSIKSRLTFDNFNIKVKKQNNWFDLQGDIKVDEESTLSLMRMLELLDTAKNRFVEIEPGIYIELEKHFVRQLEYLKTVADISTKQIKLHPLAAVSNSGLFDSVGAFTGDKEWKSFITNIRKTEKAKYELPKGLDAELRPYQEDGYRWLRKMADWGTGACLADDMGLGKTLQCLALLLSRANEGPSMVVAPTSVCRNWISETEKFAPGLQAILFGNAERKQTIETIESGALLVVSYGLLASEAELLASRKWNVLILDEAHAIKNISTKRSQVAMSIDASFKIAATGTPLQNHMGELWNLFQFLNPGLLGSQQSFNDRFVLPIEKSNNELARRSLKDLIKPFILRRTKNQVLDELPEKTEITMSIDLSTEERAFYEALRMKALDEIQKLDNSTNSGEKQIRVLAEIMKLRRACCHPSLANKDIQIESSKLQRFEELVENLIENGHKALVFSQFIGHLDLIRQMLDKRAIAYEYLDGSTPTKEREDSIKRFQAGSTDLFLISLKAGGVGLNLTAADYVIHMDPWWNPAVEDQASDRVHRIGQTKPVTIYRLVTKDTIEDKIVDLHKNKRDLADSLLEGTEAATKVTADELIGLLKGI